MEHAHHEYEISRIKSPALQVFIIVLGVFMAVLDTSVVNVAIPTMEHAFNATTAQIQWVLTGYMLMMGVMVPISGWLTDRFGAKHVFLFALAVFTVGSALCGASWSTGTIIVFRLLQAIGGGLMMPVSQAMIFRIFPPDRRGSVMGIFGISIMVAPAIGPTLSGYLVQYASWRLIFYLNVPIGIIELILGLMFMHEFAHHTSQRFDRWGFTFSTVGFFSLLYGLNNVASDGWSSPKVFGFVSLGVICVFALVIVELNMEHPMIDFRVFKDYLFTMSTIISGLIQVALFTGIFFLPIYLQNIVGLSAMRTGLLMMPAALGSAVVMPIAGRLFDRIGARPLGIVGLAGMTIVTIGFTRLSPATSVGYVQWLYILRQVAMGLTMMPIMTAGMNLLPPRQVSQGSAVSNTARQVASSLGVAILTSILDQREKFHFAVMAQNVSPFTAQGQDITKMVQMFEAQGMTPANANAAAIAEMSGVLRQHAFVMGMNDAFWVAAGLTAVGFILVLFFGSKQEAALRANRKSQPKGASTVPAME